MARHPAESGGLPTAILRPAYIIDADTLRDKYGRPLRASDWLLIARRDIGKTARLAPLPDLRWEIFTPSAAPTPEATRRLPQPRVPRLDADFDFHP